jgi:hypothetical protein
MLVCCRARDGGVWRKAFAPATPLSYEDARACLPALTANVPPRPRRTSDGQHKPCATRFVRISSRPKSVAPVLDEAKREWLWAIVHESPRSFGKHPRPWTLRLLAAICFEQGMTSRALYRVDAGCLQTDGGCRERGQALEHESGPAVRVKKSSATGCSAWQRLIREGCWASPMKSGGLLWRNPIGMRGPRTSLFDFER